MIRRSQSKLSMNHSVDLWDHPHSAQTKYSERQIVLTPRKYEIVVLVSMYAKFNMCAKTPFLTRKINISRSLIRTRARDWCAGVCVRG